LKRQTAEPEQLNSGSMKGAHTMDIRFQVYEALADILFTTKATEQDMHAAVEWFETHFFESDDNNE